MKGSNNSTLCLVMNEVTPDTKELNRNGVNNNSDEVVVYTSLNSPCVEDVNVSHEPSRSTTTNFGSRRKSETQPVRGSRRLESIDEDSECFSPAIRSTSISTMSLSTPFQGFQVPETTVVPGEVDETKAKKRVSVSLRGAIPTLPRSLAVICLLFNIFIPGTGTMLSGLFAFCLSDDDSTMIDRVSIMCMNCFVGLAQLATVVFLMIGWVWSVAWGCTFVGLSAKYGKKRTTQTTSMNLEESTIS